ncbi:MAG: hypothetical protein ABI120_25000, partial [Gemmatimonadaceae bacterium]
MRHHISLSRRTATALRGATAIGAAALAALVFVGANAQAQGQGPGNPNAGPTPSTSVPQALASTTQLETVIVTGIRKSL